MTVEKIKVSKEIKSIAIIGAGASGAVAVDVLRKEKAFEKIKVFERRETVGGVWHLDNQVDQISIVPGSNESQNDEAVDVPVGLSTKKLIVPRLQKPRFIYTPAYEDIKTNVPEHFMTFSDIPRWPDKNKPKDEPFTTRRYVEQYIKEYITPNQDVLSLRTTLERVDKDYSKPNQQFVLTLKQETDIKNENGEFVDYWWQENFDALVLATGHYHVPHIPFVEGLDEVLKKFPDRVGYAKQFRNDAKYKGKKVLVIGGSASGIDISYVLSKNSDEIYRSEKTENFDSRTKLRTIVVDGKTKLKPTVKKYLINNEEISVEFDDGSKLENVDFVIYGTGYDYSYPFLRHLWPQFSEHGVRLPQNFQHTFHIPDPLISTLGIPVGALSFRAFEYQSILISRFLSGKVELPSIQDQYSWIKNRELTLGGVTRAYHRIGHENVVSYLDDLTKLGGGVSRIGEHGREFPVITQKQVDDWKLQKSEIVEKWEKEAAIGLAWG